MLWFASSVFCFNVNLFFFSLSFRGEALVDFYLHCVGVTFEKNLPVFRDARFPTLVPLPAYRADRFRIFINFAWIWNGDGF